MLAVQGPQARAKLAQLLPEGDASGALALDSFVGAQFGRWFIARTGYTGEDGFEVMMPAEDAVAAWHSLNSLGVASCGLGARDTLRLEACFHLYGNELTIERGPIEAGLGWCCKEDTGFIGAEAVRAVREAGPAEKLVAFEITGAGIARQGNAIRGGGEVTSGTLSPCLERGIGMAYVPAERAGVGTQLEIDVRGRTRDARIVEKPFVEKRA
jgi:aminomethyltransferase